MPRNLVLSFDGTSNQFGPENTNVVRLAQAIERDPARQLLYYDPGVGTLPEPGFVTKIGKWLSDVMGLAFGAGLTWKVGEAYSYLMDFWEPGDRVFLFGFSRGAYTARVLAGLLHSLGLLPRGNQNLLPYVMRLFKAVRKDIQPPPLSPSGGDSGVRKPEQQVDKSDSEYWKLCDQFRWTFARPVPGGSDDRRFRVHFVGLWDTVSSVGWIWEPVHFPFTATNPSIDVIRHAVSVDERRQFFRQNLMYPTHGQDLQEHWFAGVHADVGGGYPTVDSGLWRLPFQWMLDEAGKAGLLIDRHRQDHVLQNPPPSATPWNDPQHESLQGLWWPAEVFPKLRWRRDRNIRVPELGLGRHRIVRDGALIHQSTLRRIRETNYAPPNLSEPFLKKVRGLSVVPDALPYAAES
jgi:uncharacterized protein (DUF2235 family)